MENVPLIINTPNFKVYDLCYEHYPCRHPCIINGLMVIKNAHYICNYCIRKEIRLPYHFQQFLISRRSNYS